MNGSTWAALTLGPNMLNKICLPKTCLELHCPHKVSVSFKHSSRLQIYIIYAVYGTLKNSDNYTFRTVEWIWNSLLHSHCPGPLEAKGLSAFPIFGIKYSIFDKLGNFLRLLDWVFVLVRGLAGHCINTNNCPHQPILELKIVSRCSPIKDLSGTRFLSALNRHV